MKKVIYTLIAAMLCILPAKAQECKPLANGTRVSVQACSDRIFRVRISPRDTFSESLMERYGILKTDWQYGGSLAAPGTLSTANGIKASLKEDGTLTFSDKKGEVISEIRLIRAGDPLIQSLGNAINEKFSSLHVASNGGIIGDDDGRFSEKDKAESGDMDKASIISIALKDGERFYGGGSTSRDHIQHRGELLRMWTTYQHTEIPMPFMVSSRGWGIFNNTTRKNFFDVGCHQADRLNIYNTCDEADFYIFIDGSMAGVIDQFTQVTGRPYVLPRWAYGLGFGPNMRENQFDILTDAAMFRQVDVPVDFFWLEPQWMEKRYDFSTQKRWNYANFSPEPYWLQDKFPKKEYPRLFVGKLKSMGINLGLWLCEEYDLSLPEEDIIAEREGRPVSGQEHWMDHLTQFMDMGINGFKLDPARTIDEHTYRSYYNGRTDKEMHNLNQILLPKQMAQTSRRHTGRRTWHHYCAGWAGTQHWGASTSGDNGGGKTALFDQLNLGMSGFMNTSCDVMSVEKELEMASLHFGVFLPWVQINSWFSMMHPFYYSDEELIIYRDYIKLRYSIAPYIYSMALEGAQTGMPMVRSMPLMFPDDSNTWDMCYQYMFGHNFLVGIFSNEVYLPKGTWYDYWTGERIDSKGETITRDYPSNRAGLLFVRAGAIIPGQCNLKHIGTKPFNNVVLKIYPQAESSYTLYEDDGDSYEFENGAIAATRIDCKAHGNSGATIHINPVSGSYKGMPEKRNYEFEVRCEHEPATVHVQGKKISEWTYENKTVKFTIKDVDSGKMLKVNIQ